jgi:uncharacterized protein
VTKPETRPPAPVVLDTNVFVAAAFKPAGDSGRVLDAVRSVALTLVWNDATRRETESILRRIPPVSWDAVAELFREESRFDSPTDPERFHSVADPDDRKFAALAAASGAALLSLDDHLLGARWEDEPIAITPARFLRDRDEHPP